MFLNGELIMKKIYVSLVLINAFSVSANAVCFSENYCSNYHVGIGGLYENTNANEAKINRAGGFISLGGYDLFFKKFHYGIDVRLGYGYTNLSGTLLSNFNKNTQFIYTELIPKIGLNLLQGDYSLFINLLYGGDIIISSSNGVGKIMLYVGPEIEGMFKITEKTKLTCSFGYGYIFGAGYIFDGSLARIKGYNQEFMFSLGTQTKISENAGFYLKGFAKYYDLNASDQVSVKNGSNNINMPTSNGWQAGIEAGMAF